MKKCKLYLQISMVVISVFVCVTFSVYTFYYLYNHDSDMAGIYATLIGIIIPLIISLCSYIITKIRKGILIERYLNDEHFVDRDIEYIKLSNLIKNESDRIIYIKGKFGMGKTSFMKMSCDRINYTDKNRWKSYAAFYYNNNYTKTITQALSNKFCGNPSASVTDISNKLNDSTLQKNSILFIDNIYEMNLIECTEFAKAFINCSRNNQVVIAVDSNDEVFHICPGQFSENEIETLRVIDCLKRSGLEIKDIKEYHIDTFVIGDDWKGKFDYLKDEGVEVIYLPRTPEISTTQIKEDLHHTEEK